MSAVNEILGVKTTTVPDYTEFREMRKAKFKRLTARAIQLKQEMEAAENEYNEVRKQLEQFFLDEGVKTVGYGSYLVGLVEGNSGPRLDKRKMVAGFLAAGVVSALVADVIREATTPGKEWMAVSIRPKKEEEDE